MMALRDGVLDGTVDCIASHHFPQDWDHKICEFEYAAFGMIGLQTSFAVVNHLLDQLTNDQLVKLFSLNARNIFNLPITNITEGAVAELTIYHRKNTTLLKKEHNKSKSVNSAFIERALNGKVYGIINNQQFITH
jgi:dihydroorotase